MKAVRYEDVTEEVTITKVVVKEPPKVVLEMTLDEAIALVIVAAHVGGHPETTLRGKIDAISHRLTQAGVPYRSRPATTSGDSIYFAGDI